MKKTKLTPNYGLMEQGAIHLVKQRYNELKKAQIKSIESFFITNDGGFGISGNLEQLQADENAAINAFRKAYENLLAIREEMNKEYQEDKSKDEN